MPSNHLAKATTPQWTSVFSAGELYERQQRLGKGTDLQFGVWPVKVRNDTGANRPLGAIVEIGDPILDDAELTRDFLWFAGEAPTGGPKFAILKNALPDDAIGEAIVTGVAIALIDVGSLSHGYARPISADYVLESADAGPVKILYAPSTGSDQLCVVVFENTRSSFNSIMVTLNASLATTGASVSANVEIVENGNLVAVNDTVTVYNMDESGGDYIFEGDSGDWFWCVWSESQGRWNLKQGECPA